MNIFRLAGDLSHLLAFIILLLKIWKTRSCAGISGRSQILFALTYTTRYLDLFSNFISIYNSVMKVFFIGASYATLYLMYVKFKATYDRNHDTFRIECLVIPAVILALVVNHDFSPLGVLWTFSIYLESVAILPQLFLVSKTGKAETIISYYLFCLGSYRALYILNWVYRYYSDGFYNLIAIIAGVVQIVLYCDFFYLYIIKAKTDGQISQALLTGNISLAVEICINDGRWADALLLAHSGGLQLLRETQKLYFKSINSDSSKLISAVVTSDWVSFIKNCNVSCWKEILDAILTYAKPEDFPSLCELLGNRLESEPTLKHYASLCYTSAGNLECLAQARSQMHEKQDVRSLQPHSISNEPAIPIKSPFPDMPAPVQPTPPLSQPVMPGGYFNPSTQTHQHPPPPPGIIGSTPYLPSQTPEEPKIAPQAFPEQPKEKSPIPPENQVLQDIFEARRGQCQQVATNPILELMQELMSRHKAYALCPRDCLKKALFEKWLRLIAPPGVTHRAGPNDYKRQPEVASEKED